MALQPSPELDQRVFLQFREHRSNMSTKDPIGEYLRTSMQQIDAIQSQLLSDYKGEKKLLNTDELIENLEAAEKRVKKITREIEVFKDSKERSGRERHSCATILVDCYELLRWIRNTTGIVKSSKSDRGKAVEKSMELIEESGTFFKKFNSTETMSTLGVPEIRSNPTPPPMSPAEAICTGVLMGVAAATIMVSHAKKKWGRK